MAFSIKQIKAILSEHNMPVDDLDKAAEDICARHSADLDSIKEERDSFKKDAETLASVQKELNELKEATNGGKKNAFEVKYNAIKEEYDNYKRDIEAKETKSKKEAAYRALLKEVGVSDKRIDAVLKVTDLDDAKLGEDGKFENASDLKKSIKDEWSDFIVTNGQKGADVSNPPAGGGKTYKSKDEIMAIKDTAERQKAIADNHEMFGF